MLPGFKWAFLIEIYPFFIVVVIVGYSQFNLPPNQWNNLKKTQFESIHGWIRSRIRNSYWLIQFPMRVAMITRFLTVMSTDQLITSKINYEKTPPETNKVVKQVCWATKNANIQSLSFLNSEDIDVGSINWENAERGINIRIESLEWYGKETLLG